MKREELTPLQAKMELLGENKRPYQRPVLDVFSVQMEEGIASASGVPSEAWDNENQEYDI